MILVPAEVRPHLVGNAAACIAGVGAAKPAILVSQSASAVPVLAQALQAHAVDTAAAYELTAALAVFAQAASPLGITAMAEAKILPLLLLALDVHRTDDMVQHKCLTIIACLLTCPAAAAEAGGCLTEVLAAAARSLRDQMSSAPAGLPENLAVADVAVSTIAIMGTDLTRMPYYARAAGVLATLLSFMRRFCADARSNKTVLTLARGCATIIAGASATTTESRDLLRSLRASDLAPAVLSRISLSRLRSSGDAPADAKAYADHITMCMQAMVRRLAGKR